MGLGFSGSSRPLQNSRKTFDDDEEATSDEAKKPEPSAAVASVADSKLKFKKMSFVKSSS